MTARLARLFELRQGGFEVTRIQSDEGALEVSLHRRGITVVLRLGRDDAWDLLNETPAARLQPVRIPRYDPARP